MKQYCGHCIHFNKRFYMICTGQKNVSNRSAWFTVWSKFRCNLKKCVEYKNYKCAYFEPTEHYLKLLERFEKEMECLKKELEVCDATFDVSIIDTNLKPSKQYLGFFENFKKYYRRNKNAKTKT